MVSSKNSISVKSPAKVAPQKTSTYSKKLDEILKVPISPSGRTLEDEVISLRARNKVLTHALQAIHEIADEQSDKHHKLVWYARNRCRFPNSKATKTIEKDDEHRKELEKLRTNDADYHHGVHSGILAAARMFKEHSDILHINEHAEVDDKLVSAATEHKQKIEQSRKLFPHTNADEMPQVQ